MMIRIDVAKTALISNLNTKQVNFMQKTKHMHQAQRSGVEKIKTRELEKEVQRLNEKMRTTNIRIDLIEKRQLYRIKGVETAIAAIATVTIVNSMALLLNI